MGVIFFRMALFSLLHFFASHNQYIIYSSDLREYLDIISLSEADNFQFSSQEVYISSAGPNKEIRSVVLKFITRNECSIE